MYLDPFLAAFQGFLCFRKRGKEKPQYEWVENIKAKLVCPRWHHFSPDRNQLESYRPLDQDAKGI